MLKNAKKNPRQRRRLGLDEVCVNLYVCIATLNTMNAHQNKLACVKKTCGFLSPRHLNLECYIKG